MSLCFDEAFDALKNNRISEEEYIHNVFAHFNGARHTADEVQTRPWELMIRDPVGNAFRESSLRVPRVQTDYTSILKKLFISILNDGPEAARIVSSNTGTSTTSSFPVQLVATFAAMHGRGQVLHECVRAGASLDERNTTTALEYTTRNSALLDVLYEYNWRDMRQSRLSFDCMAAWSLHTSPEELKWFLEHGAAFDEQSLRRTIHSAPVNATCVETLVKKFGVGIFRNTGLLQNAAKRGQTEIVQILLNAGAEVDEMISPPTHTEGETEFTALYEAVYKQHAETVRLLLEYDADPSKEVGTGALNTPLKLAEAHGYANLAATLNRSLEKRQTGSRTWTSRL